MDKNKELEELKELKRMSLEQQAQATPKENTTFGCAVGIVFLIIGIFYYFLAPSKTPIFGNGTIRYQYALEGETSIYDTISPFWGLVLIVFVGVIITNIINNILSKQYEEYNSIIANAKIELTKRENEKKQHRRKEGIIYSLILTTKNLMHLKIYTELILKSLIMEKHIT